MSLSGVRPRPTSGPLRAARLVIAALVALPATVPISGCTAIGYAVGSMVDGAVARRELGRADSIPVGARLHVCLHDGRAVDGAFVATGSFPRHEYAARYGRWRSGLGSGASLPELGDPFELALRKGGTETGRFAGLRTAGVVLANDEGRERLVRFDALTATWQRGTRASVASFTSVRETALEETLKAAPKLETVTLTTGSGDRVIAADEIEEISVTKGSIGRWTGTLLGLGGDVLFVVWMSRELGEGAGVIRDWTGHAP